MDEASRRDRSHTTEKCLALEAWGRRVEEIVSSTSRKAYPYSRTDPQPSASDTVQEIIIDPEAGREAFWYVLRSGARGYVHAEQVLDYNQDPLCETSSSIG